MALPDRIAVDSCALIEWANPDSPYRSAMTDWMRLSLLVQQVRLGGSVLLLPEARGGGRLSPNAQAEERLRKVLTDPAFTLINVDRPLGMKARDLALDLHLSNWDAVMLASAIRFGATLLLTTDNDLLNLADHEGVAIRRPYMPQGDNLYSSSEPA